MSGHLSYLLKFFSTFANKHSILPIYFIYSGSKSSLSQLSINSLFLLCFMSLLISLIDFVHVNSILDLVKLSVVFNSFLIDPHFPVIRLKEAFELAFWVSVHPFLVVSLSQVQHVVEVNRIRTVLRVQAISLQDVPMRNDLRIVLHPIPVK